MANFFATQISGGQDIAQKFSRYSLSAGKNAYTKLKYPNDLEKEKYAQQDFAYSLFFQVGKILEVDSIGMYQVDDYFFSIIKDLEPRRPLKLYPDFSDLIVSKCQGLCKNPFTTKIKLNYLMDSMKMEM